MGSPGPEAEQQAHLEAAFGIGVLFIGTVLIMGLLVVLPTKHEVNSQYDDQMNTPCSGCNAGGVSNE